MKPWQAMIVALSAAAALMVGLGVQAEANVSPPPFLQGPA
jgi:hypothetical protein